MKSVLQWQDAAKVQNLENKEKKWISTVFGEQKLDLDAGGSADNEIVGVTAFHSVFFLNTIPYGKLVLLDLGLIKNLRKVKFILNGTEIGMTNSRQTEAAYMVDTSLLRKENSLLALVIDGSAAPIWIKGVGRTDYYPEGYLGEREELPSKIELCDLQPIEAAGEPKAEGNILRLNQGEQQITMTFWKGDIVRVRVHRREKAFLIDEICLDQIEDNLQPVEQLSIENTETKNNDGILRLSLEQHRVEISMSPLEVRFYHKDGKLLLNHLPIPMQAERCCGMAVELREDEHIFGLGENATPSMDKRGQREDIWTSHDWIHCDIPVPFYISTKGYGLYLNNSHHSWFDMGRMDSRKAFIWALGGETDYFFLPGPKPKQVLANYTKVTGRTKLPPRWAFGFFQSKTGEDSAAMIEEKIKKFKEYQIPLDVISVDPNWQNDYCDWQWNEKDFPSQSDFMEMLRNHHMHLMLWSAPFVKKNCNNYSDGVKKGMFLKSEDGNTLPSLWWKDFGSGIVDFTNPEAAAWWMEQCRPLIKAGVDVFKIDGGDGGEVPADARNYQGLEGREFHNLYPLYFAKTFYEGLQLQRPGIRVMAWERTGFVGSGKYPCTWGGDQPADFIGTKVLIKGGQQAGLSGIFYWAPDVGGFAKNSSTSEEFFIRSYQWGALAPMSRGHGNQTEPYAYSERAREIVGDYIRLRYRLLPYFYSCAYEAMRDGVPMMRAMMLECPGDNECYKAEYQYFIGESLMAAPVHEHSDSKTMTVNQDVYIPEGTFIDYWTGTEYEGHSHIQYEAKLEILPLFVKKGAIIPMLTSAFHTREYDGKAYELHIYPSEDETEFSLYYDDGETLNYEKGDYDMIQIKAVMEGKQIRLKLETQKDRMENRAIQFKVLIHGRGNHIVTDILYQKGQTVSVLV